MDAPISDVPNAGIGNIANSTATEIEGFRHHVDEIFGKVDTVRAYVKD